ncbi:hypothetical protein VP1G_04347 [Cytospora mali]|uniref:Uncharacterized protein n=1 Tax=Cytospora mali TaxID=578113 RepID=A0A194UZA6_CYTMA|nr:hypothetical protein VP1G_04347 [Valsa mali var. pyri (nom. inval.)]
MVEFMLIESVADWHMPRWEKRKQKDVKESSHAKTRTDLRQEAQKRVFAQLSIRATVMHRPAVKCQVCKKSYRRKHTCYGSAHHKRPWSKRSLENNDVEARRSLARTSNHNTAAEAEAATAYHKSIALRLEGHVKDSERIIEECVSRLHAEGSMDNGVFAALYRSQANNHAYYFEFPEAHKELKKWAPVEIKPEETQMSLLWDQILCVKILKGQLDAAEGLVSELLLIYSGLQDPDIIDRLGHVRTLIAFARLPASSHDTLKRWQDVLIWNQFYNPGEEDVFTCGVVYLFLCIAWHRLGQDERSTECLLHAERIVEDKTRQSERSPQSPWFSLKSLAASANIASDAPRKVREMFWDTIEVLEQTINSRELHDTEVYWLRAETCEVIRSESSSPPSPPLEDIAFLRGLFERAGGRKDTYSYKYGRDDEMLDSFWETFGPEDARMASRLSSEQLEDLIRNIREDCQQLRSSWRKSVDELQSHVEQLIQDLTSIERTNLYFRTLLE